KGIEINERQTRVKDKWEIVDASKEKDAVIISYGPTLDVALEAKEILNKVGIQLEVVNARFIKPVDVNLLNEYGQLNTPLLVVEEVIETGGLGQYKIGRASCREGV